MVLSGDFESVKRKSMSDERKRENEEEKLKDFFHNVIGIKSEAVLEVLAENSEICKLKAKTLLMKENEKVKLW